MTDYANPNIDLQYETKVGDNDDGLQGEEVKGEKDIENIRLILIHLAEAGEIPQSVRCIEKANNKVVRKIYAKHQMKEQDKNNAVLTDVLITKFSELMGMLNTVPSGELLAAELREDKLLQRDIKKVVEFISPFIPFIGVISGGATLGKHVMQQQRCNDGVGVETNDQETPLKE